MEINSVISNVSELEEYETITSNVDEAIINSFKYKIRYHIPNFILDFGILRYRKDNNEKFVQFKILDENIAFFKAYEIVDKDTGKLKKVMESMVEFLNNTFKFNPIGYTPIKEYSKNNRIFFDGCKAYTLDILYQFYYLDYFIKHRESIIKTSFNNKSKGRNACDNSNSSKKGKTVLTVITNKNVVYKIAKNSNRKFSRLTFSWGVAGHYRHYKNGKVIFIKPYVKGTGKRNIKKYKIS
ncbi:hypothetical protein [Clostridium butyricum]|uniref:Uncharacterized protein n=1 Tax=Clostridium butyricum TaxID=1492 RepID=A0A512TR96_CLOBU|nr:hypothetical protein [Clostridium butyricum]NOW22144.1 hypothetical protein [Clostridium butyricum]GEQ22759.1 hypothetical protein CBU02nite_32650 [Clostridium butyricum]